jgi:hypothetical protein
MHQPPLLTDTDKTLLSFLLESDRFLYDFLDSSLFPTYREATQVMGRLMARDWVVTGWSDDRSAINYRITDLGKRCLETGLQLEVVAEAKTRFPWRFPN